MDGALLAVALGNGKGTAGAAKDGELEGALLSAEGGGERTADGTRDENFEGEGLSVDDG